MKILLLFSAFFVVNGWYYGRAEPNAWTTGGVWPLPWQITYFPGNHSVNPSKFRLQAKTPGCDVIDKAIQRYQTLAFPGFNPSQYAGDGGTLSSIIVNVVASCPTGVPPFNMDESYWLRFGSIRSIRPRREVSQS